MRILGLGVDLADSDRLDSVLGKVCPVRGLRLHEHERELPSGSLDRSGGLQRGSLERRRS